MPCKESHLRIKHEFQGVTENNDRRGYRLARQILNGKYEWLEQGMVAKKINLESVKVMRHCEAV